MDKTLKKILSSDYLLKTIYSNFNVAAIFLGGSRSLGLNTEESDYDLNIIVCDTSKKALNNYNELFKKYPCGYFKDNKNTIHWSYTFSKFEDNYNIPYFKYWAIEAYYAYKNNENDLLIIDNNIANYHKLTMRNWLPKALKKCIEEDKIYMQNILYFKPNSAEFKSRVDTKVYHLCLINRLLKTDGNLSAEDRDILIKIKQYAKCNQKMRSTASRDYFDNNSMSWVLNNIQELLTIDIENNEVQITC